MVHLIGRSNVMTTPRSGCIDFRFGNVGFAVEGLRCIWSGIDIIILLGQCDAFTFWFHSLCNATESGNRHQLKIINNAYQWQNAETRFNKSRDKVFFVFRSFFVWAVCGFLPKQLWIVALDCYCVQLRPSVNVKLGRNR